MRFSFSWQDKPIISWERSATKEISPSPLDAFRKARGGAAVTTLKTAEVHNGRTNFLLFSSKNYQAWRFELCDPLLWVAFIWRREQFRTGLCKDICTSIPSLIGKCFSVRVACKTLKFASQRIDDKGLEKTILKIQIIHSSNLDEFWASSIHALQNRSRFAATVSVDFFEWYSRNIFTNSLIEQR